MCGLVFFIIILKNGYTYQQHSRDLHQMIGLLCKQSDLVPAKHGMIIKMSLLALEMSPDKLDLLLKTITSIEICFVSCGKNMCFVVQSQRPPGKP